MYGALWRVLPGHWIVKVLILLIAVAAILYGLFYYVYPWIGAILVPQEATIE